MTVAAASWLASLMIRTATASPGWTFRNGIPWRTSTRGAGTPRAAEPASPDAGGREHLDGVGRPLGADLRPLDLEQAGLVVEASSTFLSFSAAGGARGEEDRRPPSTARSLGLVTRGRRSRDFFSAVDQACRSRVTLNASRADGEP